MDDSKLDVSHPLHLYPNDSATLNVVSIKRSNTDEVLTFEFWNELKETFDRVDRSATFILHQKINSLSQNGAPIDDYFNKLSTLWKQFDALVKLPRCTCHAVEDFKKHNQLMKLMKFLMSLDDSNMQLRSNILSRELLLDAKGTYVIIFNEESYKAVVTDSGAGTSQRS
ncbi:ribonuclease H-like domain-containing protein [Tanacetum coccineum]